MNLVRFAMRRPVTVLVIIIGIVLVSFMAISRMAVDIFPDLGIPVIYVAQPYGGMDPAQMEGYLTNYYEYHFLYISGIEHVESKSIQGVALMKLYFHPGTTMPQAMSEVIGYVNRSRAFMPPGTVPPFVMRFDAGSVPVGFLVLSSKTRGIQEIQDQALFRVRPLFASLPGVSAPPPFGGSQRTIVVRIDPDRLNAYHLSADDVTTALSSGNLITPSGNAYMGDLMPMVRVNSVAPDVKELGNIAVRGGNPSVYLRDLGKIEDASDIATGYALVDGKRTVYIPVTKRADASTLAVVKQVKAALPSLRAAVSEDVSVDFQFDQSPVVTGAINGLSVEGGLGAMLTGLMVLLFLRDWRSALIIVLNIPLAIMGSLLALWLTGQTLNIMTLGGLALSIGILVDEATVTIENIHTHRGGRGRGGKTLARAVMDGSVETAVPRLLAMLCVLAVFIPSFLMFGVAKAMFVPLSLAVGFAMLSSYLLSSTFVPVITTWILRDEHAADAHAAPLARLRQRYATMLERVMHWRIALFAGYILSAALIIVLVGMWLGVEIYPASDAGQFQLRIRAAEGTRIESTEALAVRTLEVIKAEVGDGNLQTSIGFVGISPPAYPIHTVYLWMGGPHEAMLRVGLRPGSGIAIAKLKERLREQLPKAMPGVNFSFEAGDIVSEVMSFGSPTPVEIAVSGKDLAADRAYAEKLMARLKTDPAFRDLQFGQSLNYPVWDVTINRERAGLSGVTAAEIGRSLVAATSSSRFVVPNFWADPKSGIGYQVQVEIPRSRMDSIESVKNIPVKSSASGEVALRDLAEVKVASSPGEYDRYNMLRMVTLTANLAGRDLGKGAREIDKALKDVGSPPTGVTVAVRGQLPPLEQIRNGLALGLALAVVTILLLLTAYFQSLRLALLAIATVPAVIAGVVLALLVTGTTLNLQSFMGTIMAVGVAVANAILLLTFAERERLAGSEAPAAAISGAQSRLRPILMTSLAMIAGMIPMSLGFGQAGAQTAPLGRAVIGGLLAATVATLLVLPALFAMLQRRASTRSGSLDPDDVESVHGPTGQQETRAALLVIPQFNDGGENGPNAIT